MRFTSHGWSCLNTSLAQALNLFRHLPSTSVAVLVVHTGRVSPRQSLYASTMPIADITAADQANLAALMSPDLAAELRRQQVSEPLLCTLSQAGFRTVRKFQMIAHSEQNLEEVSAMFGLDRKVMADFSDICSLKAAWASVRVYQQKEDVVRAETKIWV